MKYKRFFVSKEDLKEGVLRGEEFNHAANVLRMKAGDFISLFCGDDFDTVAEIVAIKKNELTFRVNERVRNSANPRLHITLVQALAKGEKLEFIAQKATEIGASVLLPFYSEFCDVKPKTTRLDRLDKISIGACKQCGRSKPLDIRPIVSLLDIDLSEFDTVLFANECETSKRLGETNLRDGKFAVIVGSEGGFSKSEIDMLMKQNAKSISLGKRILRTETAGIYILSYLAERLGV